MKKQEAYIITRGRENIATLFIKKETPEAMAEWQRRYPGTSRICLHHTEDADACGRRTDNKKRLGERSYISPHRMTEFKISHKTS